MTPFVVPAALLAVLVPQTSSASTDEDASAYLDACRAKLGAPAELTRIHNLRAHGKAAWGGEHHGDTPGFEKGFVTEIYGGLGKALITTEFPAFGKFEMGADGKVVWERSPLDVVVREGWDASEYMRRFGIAQHVDWRAMYEKARFIGSESIDGRTCKKVQLFPRMLVQADEKTRALTPQPDVWLIDAGTMLPRLVRAKSVGLLDEPTEMIIGMRNWKEVDGVQYPHTVDVTINAFTLTIDYESFEHNVSLPDDIFVVGDDVRVAVARARTPKDQRGDEDIRVEVLEERHIASIRAQCSVADLQKTLSVLLPEVMTHVFSSGASAAGAPLVRYHQWGNDLDIEAAIPVHEPTEAKGRVEPRTLPAGEAAVVWHIGPYHELDRTHRRLEAFLEQEGLELRGAAWEEYLTDPGVEPDPSKWRTRVVWPVRPRKD